MRPHISKPLYCYLYSDAQLCQTLCDLMNYSLPGSSVYGILLARILEWGAIFSSGDLIDPGIEPVSLASPTLASGFFQKALFEEILFLNYNLPTILNRESVQRSLINLLSNWNNDQLGEELESSYFLMSKEYFYQPRPLSHLLIITVKYNFFLQYSL